MGLLRVWRQVGEVSGEEIQELVSALPDAEPVTVPDAGHMLPLTHPDVVVLHVRRWVESVATATSRP